MPPGAVLGALRKGFTLIELLAVMAVIATLLSLAAVGVERMSGGQGLNAGISVSEQVFAQARSLAISRGAPVRIAIHNEIDDSNPQSKERFHRMMVVLQQEIDKETGRAINGSWKQVNQPVMLPQGVYYSTRLSSRSVYTKQNMPEQQHQLGKRPSDTASCVVYEINGQGISSNPGATFVLAAGARPPGQKDVILGQERTVAGFIIYRNGNTAPIRDVEKIFTSGS